MKFIISLIFLFLFSQSYSSLKLKDGQAEKITAIPDKPFELSFIEEGEASWYGQGFHGKKTASGERFDTNEMTAAHKTLPFGKLIKVTNLSNDEFVIVRINDRGPFVRGRIIDLSQAAKNAIKMGGTTKVKLEEVI